MQHIYGYGTAPPAAASQATLKIPITVATIERHDDEKTTTANSAIQATQHC